MIGAFKHAGRKRMAFSIGTRMAEFHKLVVVKMPFTWTHCSPSSHQARWHGEGGGASTVRRHQSTLGAALAPAVLLSVLHPEVLSGQTETGG